MVLYTYPADFTFVCASELVAFSNLKKAMGSVISDRRLRVRGLRDLSEFRGFSACRFRAGCLPCKNGVFGVQSCRVLGSGPESLTPQDGFKGSGESMASP